MANSGDRVTKAKNVISDFLIPIAVVGFFGSLAVFFLALSAPDSEFIATFSAVSNVILVGFLIFVYVRQNRILTSQLNVQEDQAKLAKSQFIPYVVGPFDFKYSLPEGKIRFKLANSGGGVAQYLEVYPKLTPLGEEHDFRVKTYPVPITRSGETIRDLSVIHPNDGRLEFESSPMVGVAESDENFGYLPLHEAIDYLIDEGVTAFEVEFEVIYEDRFGEKSDPFGQDYRVFIWSVKSTNNRSVEDVFQGVPNIVLT